MQEIRSEVMWEGSVNLSYPTEIDAGTKYRVTADTSFTIKGWLFRNDNNPVSNVYTVSANFYPVSAIDVDDYYSAQQLLSYNDQLSSNKDTIVVKALPDTTNITFTYGNNTLSTGYFNIGNLPKITLNGGFLSNNPQMEYTKKVFLSANNSVLPTLSSVDFYSNTSLASSNPPFSAYEITTNGGQVTYDGSVILINLPPVSASCNFSLIVSNESGYKSYLQGVIQ